MREIEFRAWCPIDNRHYYDAVVGGRIVIASYEVEDNDLETLYITCENGLHPSPFVIEQYIGMKDRNGIKAYEGDIVEYGVTNDKKIKPSVEYMKAQIVWQQERYFSGTIIECKFDLSMVGKTSETWIKSCFTPYNEPVTI